MDLDYKESWVSKNDAFELWCWRRLLRVPWTPRNSNQSILKEISPEYSLKGLMLKLELQNFGVRHLMWRTDSLEKTTMLGKIEGRKRRGWQRMIWLDTITDLMEWVWASTGSWWWTGKSGVLQFMGLQRVGHDWATELNWMPSSGIARSCGNSIFSFLIPTDCMRVPYLPWGKNIVWALKKEVGFKENT